MGWLKIQKLEYLPENGTQLFQEMKTFLTYASDDIFREVMIL